MDYEKLVEGNYDEFVSDLKVAFFDVTARNQAIMDKIEVALSHEEDQERINSLQTLWADYHDAVKGCIGGANLIASSVEQLEKCSSMFEVLMGKEKSQKERKKMVEEEEVIQAPIVELPAEAIAEIPDEKGVIDDEEVISPVEAEEISTDAVELPPVEKMEISDPKETIVPVEVESSMPDPIKTISAPVVESVPAIVEPTLVAPPEMAPIVSAPVELASTVPMVSAPVVSPSVDVPQMVVEQTPAIVEPSAMPTPEMVAAVPETPISVAVPPVTIPAQEAISAPEVSVPVVSAPVQDAVPVMSAPVPNLSLVSEASPVEEAVPIVTASTPTTLEPINASTTLDSVPSIVEATVPPMITATEAVETPSIVSSTPVPETPVVTEQVTAELPKVTATVNAEVPVVTETAAAVPEITEKPVEVATPAVVLEPIKEEAPQTEAAVEKEKVVEATPSVLLPTIEEKVEKVSEEPKEGLIIPFPQEKENKEELTSEKKNLGVLDLEPVEENKGSAEIKNLLTFVKKSDLEDKAILVTKNQAQKLRYSKDLQSALIRSIHPTSTKTDDMEEVTEAQLEDMMNQLSSLYEQGKMDEAEKMSEQISVLSKKLKPAA